VLLAKHAQHVVLIHFPIALFIIAVAFDLLAYRLRRQDYAAVAYYNLSSGCDFCSANGPHRAPRKRIADGASQA